MIFRKEPKLRVLQTRVTQQLFSELNTLAKKEKTSVSNICRIFIEDGLTRLKQDA